jgi:hypothetical protein
MAGTELSAVDAYMEGVQAFVGAVVRGTLA